MAQHHHSVETDLPVEVLWEFVREMDHWAPFLTGYQSHEKRSETDSLWTLKGDVGVLTRTLTMDVRITEWAGPERVRFELAGVNEPMQGRGSFRMESIARGEGASGDPPASHASGGGVAASSPARPRGLAALWDRLVRFLFRRYRGAAPARPEAPLTSGRTRMTFELRIEPGGPMGPMIDAMMKPAMAAAAEDLAERIIGHLESRSAESAPAKECT